MGVWYEYQLCNPTPTDQQDSCPPPGKKGINPSGGQPPYLFGYDGNFPFQDFGLTVSGTLFGRPTAAGTYRFQITVTDNADAEVGGDTVLVIREAGGAPSPGPGPAPTPPPAPQADEAVTFTISSASCRFIGPDRKQLVASGTASGPVGTQVLTVGRNVSSSSFTSSWGDGRTNGARRGAGQPGRTDWTVTYTLVGSSPTTQLDGRATYESTVVRDSRVVNCS